MKELTPKKIVRELNKYIIGQSQAKKSVAIALRNRWRRQQVDRPLRDEISPNNIILIGSTGVGKTEISRRLATMVNAISQRTNELQKVVIQGGGLLGLYACGLLKELGVSQIFCLEIAEKRFQFIEAFGAIPVDAQDLQNATRFIFDQVGEGVDAVFEVAGIKELIPQGIELLRPGGDYILVGLVHPDSKLDITGEQIIRKCLHIKGIHNYAPRHLDEAISFLERNRDRFPFDSLVSTPFKLEEIENEFGEELIWKNIDTDRDARIIIEKGNCFLQNKDEWDDYIDWMIKYLKIFQKVFSNRLKNLDI